MRETESALEILERARQIDPENEAIAGMIRRLSSDDLVQAQIDEIESSARSEIDKALSKYDLYRAVGQSEDALAAMSEAERVDPDHQRVIDFRFAEALGRGDLDAAGRIAARAADANVDGVDGLLYQGRLQLARGESAAAVRTLRSAIELVPSSVAIRRYLGQALLVTGQVDEGIESLRRVRGSPGQLRCAR
ncbi:MAG: tetratricopeptide repeat protein [Phycisphaerales bacterium]